jgi:hypothetical protein
MSNKTKFRFVYSDGSLAWAEVLRYDPSTRTVAVEITHTNKRNVKCVSHRDYACHTNARGVMYFDAFGTRFYSDGMVCGKGACNA